MRAQPLVPQGVKKTSGVVAICCGHGIRPCVIPRNPPRRSAPRLPEQTAAFLLEIQALEPHAEGDAGPGIPVVAFRTSTVEHRLDRSGAALRLSCRAMHW